MNWTQKIIRTLLLTVVLAILAWLFYDHFLAFVLNQLRDLDVSIQATSIIPDGSSLYTFVAVVGLLPALFLFSHFVLKSQKPSTYLFIALTALLSGIVMVFVHIYVLRSEIQQMKQFETPFLIIQNSVSIEKISPERYLGIGFLIGAIVSTAIVSYMKRDRTP